MIKTLCKIRIDEKVIRKAYIKISNILTDEILDALPQAQGEGMGGHIFFFLNKVGLGLQKN